MLEVFKRRIIKLLKRRDYKPLKTAKLAGLLGVGPEDYPQFKSAVEQMRQAGHLVIGTGNLVSLPLISGRITGIFSASRKGFGFVRPLQPASHGDLFIPPGKEAGAMTGDTVAVKVVKRGKRTGEMRYSGKVIEIIERAKNRFVGTLSKQHDGWIVQPDGTGFTEPICVDDIEAKSARQKDKVVVEILCWPTEKYLARGVIIEVLGRAGQYESEIKSIIRQYHLPEGFDDGCIE